jgi:hypothetical protein
MERDNISVDKLDVDNYNTWAFRMELLLKHKGLWAAVKPVEGAEVTQVDKEKAYSLIGLCLAEHHLPLYRTCDTASAAWTALESAYKAKATARKMQLRRDLTSLRKEPPEPITKYLARARTLKLELEATGDTITESEVVMAALAGLPHDYDMLVAIMEMGDAADLTLDKILPKLLIVEQKLKKTEAPDTKAYLLRSPAPPRADSGTAGRSTQAPGPRTSTSETRECFYCKKKGHIARDCRKKKRDEGNRRQRTNLRP